MPCWVQRLLFSPQLMEHSREISGIIFQVSLVIPTIKSHNIISRAMFLRFTSDYPYLESHLQLQHVTDVGNQIISNKHVNAHFSGLASQSRRIDDSFENLASENSRQRCSSQNHARDPDLQFPVLEAMSASQTSSMAESSQQGAFTNMPNAWTTVSAAHLLGAQSSRPHRIC
ncbi:uncharacterized protein LOC120160292 [Hibiscus syriacus]|uniref:uncharacterized protein LOC120160292 n=1 Tax=Hibiscus syriacus TaxID=106335 RepID=UPI0019242539|nr:uncharacterized protein LOC120160292 [Hibiscus syriacus]